MPTIVMINTAVPGMNRYEKNALRLVASAVVRGSNRVVTGAQRILVWRKSKAGPGGRASGTLARSVAAQVTVNPTSVVALVGTGQAYAKFVEGWPMPPKWHIVPFSKAPEYRRYLELHGVKVPKSATGWPAGGPNSSTPFLRPSFKENAPRFVQDVEAAVSAARP